MRTRAPPADAAVIPVDAGPGRLRVDRLGDELAGYHAYHATRAHLLRTLNRRQEAAAAYDTAIELAGNTAETAYLIRRRAELE